MLYRYVLFCCQYWTCWYNVQSLQLLSIAVCSIFVTWYLACNAWSFMPIISLSVIILLVTCIQGVYNFIPETNLVSRLYSVAAVLYLQSVLQVMLFCPWNMFCCCCCYYYYYYYVTWNSETTKYKLMKMDNYYGHHSFQSHINLLVPELFF
jgi:hypothetical protein